MTEGTTPAGAGFICVWAAGNIPAWKQEEMEFERYALGFYRELSGRGHDIDLHENGHIWIGITEDGYRSTSSRWPWTRTCADKRVLDAEQVAELLPIVEPSKIVGGVYHPGSIYLSTSLATHALAREAEAAGAEIRTHSPVSELLVEDGRVRGVRTAGGELEADNVVLALGAWTNSLLEAARRLAADRAGDRDPDHHGAPRPAADPAELPVSGDAPDVDPGACRGAAVRR